MSFVDQYGLTLTTDSSAAAGAFVEALDLALGNHVGARERLRVALGFDPEFALARALLAFLLQFDGERQPPITQIVVAARHAKNATRREQQVVAALRRALTGDTVGARRAVHAHLREFPRDALMIRECVMLANYGGGSARKVSVATTLGRLAPDMGNDPWFLGVYSLAMSEIGELETATRMADAALAARPEHVVAAHAVAHIHFERGDESGARDFLRSWLGLHGDDALSAGHLNWHLALTHLALGEPDRAIDTYRTQRTAARAQTFTVEDKISLLWRLHLRGIDVRLDLAEAADERIAAAPQRAFRLAHVAFAMAALGDADRLHQLRDDVADEATAHPQEPLRYLPPLVDGLRLLALEKWTDAAESIASATAGARRLGGSNEQHTVLDETAAYARQRATVNR